MFQLMIADDNPYILQELCTITDWEDFDLHLAGSYPNGKALLSAAEKEVPDVVLTDISMPVMDGISLAAALKQLSPDIKIIFISCYADFEYARQAMQMQISGYILKPFEMDQLSGVMTKVLRDLCTERFQRFEQDCRLRQAETFRTLAIENYMCELLYHSKDDALIRSQLESLLPSQADFCILRVASVTLNRSIKASYNDTINRIRSILQSYPGKEYKLILLPVNARSFAILILYSRQEYDIANLLASLNVDMETQTGLQAVIGFSAASGHLSSIPSLYDQAKDAAAFHLSTRHTVIGYEDIQTQHTGQDSGLPANSGYVEKMQAFIRAHYREPITTNDVAASVFLSSGYANQCFAAECGCTIFDFITQCRMNEAKRLLSETDTKITSIAELSGYSGKTSFYLSFKRNVGMSPTEYRRMHTD